MNFLKTMFRGAILASIVTLLTIIFMALVVGSIFLLTFIFINISIDTISGVIGISFMLGWMYYFGNVIKDLKVFGYDIFKYLR